MSHGAARKLSSPQLVRKTGEVTRSLWIDKICIIMKNAQMVCVLHGKVPLDEDFETYSSSCCDETTVWSELALLGRNDLTAG